MKTPSFSHLLLAGVLVAAGCSSSSSESGGDAGSGGAGSGGAAGQAHTPTAVTGTVERGQYLVDHVLACGVCHTPNGPDGKPDMTRYLAGSRSYDFTDKDGTIVTVNAENLTSHNPEGLFTWTDEQIRTALTVGIDDEKIALYPIMPYPEYSLLTRSDVDSIIQYLRTIPPNDNVVAADYPYFDQNPPAPALDGSKVPHTTLAASDPDYAAAERGRYLAAAACLSCHTEQLGEDVPNMAKAFAGGKKYTLIRGAPVHTSVNLTPDATGLGDWSIADIVASIKTNTEKGTGRVLCNSHPGGDQYLGKMADGDIQDIATYLHTLPPVANGPFQCVQP
jgi:mono/diheme cytochrome c family protein